MCLPDIHSIDELNWQLIQFWCNLTGFAWPPCSNTVYFTAEIHRKCWKCTVIFLGSAATQLRWCGRFYIIYVQWLFLIEMVTTRYHKNRSGLLFGNHRPPRQKLGVKYDTEGLTYQPKIVYTQKSLVSLIIRQQFFLHHVPTVSKCNKVAFTWAHQGMVYVRGFQRQPSPSFLSTTSLPPATVWTYQQYALHVYSFLTYRLTGYIYFLF